MMGGRGDDIYRVDHQDDRAYDSAKDDHDTLLTSVSYSLSPNSRIEEMEAYGSRHVNLIGNRFDNILHANSGQNLLVGGGGSDTFVFHSHPSRYVDTILDFRPGVDRIALEEDIFDRNGIAYDPAIGELSFNGSAIVILANKPAADSHFIMI
jgi:Ca2+-binding RTX toxin-like protein